MLSKLENVRKCLDKYCFQDFNSFGFEFELKLNENRHFSLLLESIINKCHKEIKVKSNIKTNDISIYILFEEIYYV